MSHRSDFYSSRVPGVENRAQVMFMFAAWAANKRTPPTIHDIMKRWGMSKATAYRYRQALIGACIIQETH